MATHDSSNTTHQTQSCAGPGGRSRSNDAPIVSPLHNSANLPIISLSGLLELLQWMQTHQSAIQGGDPCPEPQPPLSPPAPAGPAGARATLESADGRAASANIDDTQRRRRSTAQRCSRRTGRARCTAISLVLKIVEEDPHL